MKFNTCLLSLVAAASVYASNFSNNLISGSYTGRLIARSNEVLTAATASDSSSQCKNTLVELMNECMTKEENITKENFKELCEKFQNPKCEKLLNTDVTTIEDCNGLLTGFTNSMLRYYQITMKHICTKDESGNFCPLYEFSLDKKNMEELQSLDENSAKMTEISNKIITETCKSKNCVEASKNYANEMKSYNVLLVEMLATTQIIDGNNQTEVNEMKDALDSSYQEFIDALNADNCTSLTSGANTNGAKINSIFLAAIVGLLYYLF